MSLLGSLLSERRIKKGLELKDISKECNIFKGYLEQIEAGEFKSLPSYAHACNFTKKYAEYLEFNFEEEVAPLLSEECHKDDFEQFQAPPPSPAKHLSLMDKRNRIVLFASFALVALIAIGTYYFQSRPPQEDNNLDAQTTTETLVDETQEDTPAEEQKSIDQPEKEVEISTDAADDTEEEDVQQPTLAALEDTQPDAQEETAHQEDTHPVTTNADDNEATENNEMIENEETEDAAEAVSSVDQAEPEAPLPNINSAKMYFTDICWIYYETDSGIIREFIAYPGNVITIDFNTSFLLDIGNAEAITIQYGLQTITGFGKTGQVRKNLKFIVKDGELGY